MRRRVTHSVCKIILGSLIRPVGGVYAGPLRRLKVVASEDV